MDVFAHALWSGVIFKAIKLKTKKKLNIYLSIFFGILPDVLSFTALFVWLIFTLISGSMDISDFPNPKEIEPLQKDTAFIFVFTHTLYTLMHSLIFFIFAFLLVLFIFRRIIWEMFAWMMHILIDIPTHSYTFYPTPFLWPISSWKFNGISWFEPWFMIINYSLIIIFYIIIRRLKVNKV